MSVDSTLESMQWLHLAKTANALGAHRFLFVTVIIICKMKLFCRRIQSYRYSQHGHNFLSYLLETHWSYFTQIKSLDPESRRLGSITLQFTKIAAKRTFDDERTKYEYQLLALGSTDRHEFPRVNCGAESDWLLPLATSYAVYFCFISPYTIAPANSVHIRIALACSPEQLYSNFIITKTRLIFTVMQFLCEGEILFHRMSFDNYIHTQHTYSNNRNCCQGTKNNHSNIDTL